MKKEFVEVARKVIKKIGEEALFDIVSTWSDKPILDINLEEAIEQLSEKKPELLKLIDSNFKGKIEVSLLEGFTRYYM